MLMISFIDGFEDTFFELKLDLDENLDMSEFTDIFHLIASESLSTDFLVSHVVCLASDLFLVFDLNFKDLN